MNIAILLATFWVSTTGSNAADGSSAHPWATLQHAADEVEAGDVVRVAAGTYRGFQLTNSGTESQPITFLASPGVVIDQDNPETSDGINLEGASHVVIDGFEIVGVSRAGIRAVECERVVIRNVVAKDNGRWGIFTGFCDDLLIEDNETSGSLDEHGIYVSNSGDRPIIRRNRVHHNNANGIHMNGDVGVGGDGIISGGLVEDNIIWENGTGGGSAINCDGVQNTRIVNNLLYNNHASGISLYRIDGGGGSTGNVVVNNTIIVASNGRWAVNIQDGSTGNTLYNNILFNRHSSRGAIDISSNSTANLKSDYNVVIGKFSIGDNARTFAQWQGEGFDAHSVVSTESSVFVNPGANNYHLSATSPARDMGTSSHAPDTDLAGESRPRGEGYDVGAYEDCEQDCSPPSEPDAGPSDPGPDAGPSDPSPDAAPSDPPEPDAGPSGPGLDAGPQVPPDGGDDWGGDADAGPSGPGTPDGGDDGSPATPTPPDNLGGGCHVGGQPGLGGLLAFALAFGFAGCAMMRRPRRRRDV